ncbi:hypothetical protein DVH24_022870 [Malus domestica]|uniref:F-box domain-containing protein n=1 Tax=Malus domestica TaxID=3750 RepID=A0A498KMJ8_MALDO|nr:hypothetical protein DVH24_022870 [Malus domestica]
MGGSPLAPREWVSPDLARRGCRCVELHVVSPRLVYLKLCKVWFNICKNPLRWRTIDMRGGNLYSLGKNSSRLTSLRLVQSYVVEMGKVASKLPLMEYLEISLFPSESHVNPCKWSDDLELHGLQHLQVFGNELTDEGLQEILDCCPRLVSLDLHYCFNLKVDGDLRMRYSIADYEFAEAAQDDVICSELERRQYRMYNNYDYDYDYDYDIPTYGDFYLKTHTHPRNMDVIVLFVIV